MLKTLLLAWTLAAAQFPNATPPRKTAPAPVLAPEPDVQMKRVLNKLSELGPKPIESLQPAEARQQPTPTDAAKAVLKEQGVTIELDAVRKIEECEMQLSGHSLDARIYTPRAEGPFPVIVYYHGGGWVLGDLDTYDASARALCAGAKAVVVAVQCRQAPEIKFPAAHEDAYGAYQWVLQNAAQFQGDPQRIAVAGESAGGNLAAAVCMMAREGGVQMPIYQALIYPVAATGMDTSSYKSNSTAHPLNAGAMKWFFAQYLKNPEDYENPALALTSATDLNGLPPATVINAEIDPLRDEGEQYAKLLAKAGVSVVQKTYPGVTHEFFGMGAVLDKAKDAQKLVCTNLRAAFGSRD